MGFLEKFLPKEDRAAALLLYGMVLATCFNGMFYIRHWQHCLAPF